MRAKNGSLVPGPASDHLRPHQVVAVERAAQHTGFIDDQNAGDAVLLHHFSSLHRQCIAPDGSRTGVHDITRLQRAQIDALKAEPWRAVYLLEPLKADTSRYVQNSVANWLNDAAKSHPVFVRDLLTRWQTESPTAATGYIVRRGMRSCAAR